MREVIISRAARDALTDAQDWFTQFGAGPAAWNKWVALRNAPQTLIQFPYRGAPSVEFAGCRQLTMSGYRILYRVRPDTGDSATAGDVLVLAIFGPGTP